MLTIRRREGESVLIGPDIEVRVASSRNGEVHLNIDAPRSVQVDRKEVRTGAVPRRRTLPSMGKGDDHA